MPKPKSQAGTSGRANIMIVTEEVNVSVEDEALMSIRNLFEGRRVLPKADRDDAGAFETDSDSDPDADVDESAIRNDHFEVETIIEKMIHRDGSVKYLVIFKEDDDDEGTWVDRKDLRCDHLVRKFEQLDVPPLYPVKEIQKIRRRPSTDQLEFFIRWEGWDAKFDAWEPAENLSPDLIDEILAKWAELEQAVARATTCTICNEECSTQSKLKKHYSETHEDEVRPKIECAVCNKAVFDIAAHAHRIHDLE